MCIDLILPPNFGPFSITDEDGDWVSIVDGEDLNIAVESSAGGTLRLRISPLVAGKSLRTDPSSTTATDGATQPPATTLTSAPPPPSPKVDSPAQQPRDTESSDDRGSAAGEEGQNPEEHFMVFLQHLLGQTPPHVQRFVGGFNRFHSCESVAGDLLPETSLSPGSRGPGVEQLQHFLIR